jgi:hypothetical protein
VSNFWEKFFLSEHDEALWRAALLADIDGIKKIIETTDASVFIPPLEMAMEWRPRMFLRWSL